LSRIERIGDATLYLGDCLEILPTLPKVDAVITDPPYGKRERVKRAAAGRGWNRNSQDKFVPSKDYPEIHGDDAPFDPAPWLSFAKVILWGGNHFSARLPDRKTRWLIWDKRCGMGEDDNADCEMAWTNLRGPDRIFRHLWRGICRAGDENIANGVGLVHPMQKPVALARWCLLQAGVQAGETVVDGYMGSASVGIACAESGVRYVGCETVPHYFDIACERIDNAYRQTRMFA
jgi:site-specific DNA-methyltransferase (adenine-specific)